MQHQMMGYDRSVTMFSPEGDLLQVEYAEKAVRRGNASIGMICKDGVVIIADKGKKDELIVLKSADKIVFMEKGRISKIGTHAELITSFGPYRQIFKRYMTLPPLVIEGS